MKKIRNKLIMQICVLSCGICLTLGIVICYILYNSSFKNMEKNVMQSADAYSESVSQTINNFKFKCEAISTAISTSEIMSDATTSKYWKENKLFALSKVYGFNEAMIADSNGKGLNEEDVSANDFFKRANMGYTIISSPTKSKKDSSTVLYVASKIVNGDGIVYASIKSQDFSKMVNNIKIGNTGYGFIVDKQGTIIAHNNQELVDNSVNYIKQAEQDAAVKAEAAVIETMISGQPGEKSTMFLGKQQYISYRPIPGTNDWTLAVVADERDMLSDFYTSLYITVILTVVFVLLAAILAFKFANRISKPIVAISKRIELLAQGDLETEVPTVKSRDETFVLAESLGQTVTKLKGYIKEMDYMLSSISQGNLNVKTQYDYVGDFMPLKESMDKIVDSLNETMMQISIASDEVARGSNQVAGGAQALSQGAAEQASAIEQLSEKISEILTQIKDNAANAAKASSVSNDAAHAVEYGNRKMSEMTVAMNEISYSSNEIGKIIKAIEDIAFQTNILALNAAVEAARAGSAGKGFAVVADEVRNLASKSAEAAKNTTDLIEKSVEQVKKGDVLTSKTAKSLSDIVEGTAKINEIVNQITEVSNIQATSAMEVTQGIERISDVVQTNSATAQQSAAASEELSSQAQMLKAMVSKFILKKDQGLFEQESHSKNTVNV